VVCNLLHLRNAKRSGGDERCILLQIASMLWEDANLDNTRVQQFSITAAVLALLATILGTLAAGDGTLRIDAQLSLAVQQWQGSLPAAIERIGDMSGETLTAIIVVGGSLVVAVLMGNWRIASFLVAVGVLRVVGSMLKPIFASPRPGEDEVTIRGLSDGFGYPSGHSMTAAMIAAMAALLAWNTDMGRRYRWLVAALAIVLMLVVGWSRIWSGAHWPTDVLGGWSYGVALVLFAWGIAIKVAGSQIGSRWRR
jgi:undecaprenyl-diphosphatase